MTTTSSTFPSHSEKILTLDSLAASSRALAAAARNLLTSSCADDIRSGGEVNPVLPTERTPPAGDGAKPLASRVMKAATKAANVDREIIIIVFAFFTEFFF